MEYSLHDFAFAKLINVKPQISNLRLGFSTQQSDMIGTIIVEYYIFYLSGQYDLPSWLHRLLSTVFSDERNDCTNSFYPSIPSVN